MQTSNSKRTYFPAIDGLRFFAFFLVLIHHYLPALRAFPADSLIGQLLTRIHYFGWAGVEVFLVLSSFLLFTLLLKERQQTGTVQIKSFFIRRALRIWPLYFPYLLVAMLVAPFITGTEAILSDVLTHHMLTFMTFTANFSYALFPGLLSQFFAHLWTISLEEQFYLFVPFIIFFGSFLRGRVLWVAGILLVLTAAFRWFVLQNAIAYPMVWVNPLCRLDPFVLGALCAYALHINPALTESKRGWLWLLGALACYTIVMCYPTIGTSKHTIWQMTLVDVAGAFLTMSVITKRGLGGLFSLRFLPFLGKISFGLYVYHEAVLYCFSVISLPEIVSQLTPLGWLLKLILIMATTIAVATISYLFYERRFLKLKERFEQIQSRPA